MKNQTLLLLLLASPVSMATTFQTPLETSQWVLESTPYVCRLEHYIEGFGTGSILHHAGLARTVELDGQGYRFAEGKVSITSDPPAWRPGKSPQVIAKLAPEAGRVPVSAGLAGEIMVALEAGMLVGFKGVMGDAGTRPVEVFLSGVGFRQSSDEFRQCEENLLPASFEQLERSRIQYPVGAIEIPPSGRELLDKMATYLTTDATVQQIYVDGHSDAQGLQRDNVSVSEQRANLVTEYLLGKGVPADKITTRYHGEKYPVARNDTASNRAKNRRTTIRLSREAVAPAVASADSAPVTPSTSAVDPDS